MTDDPSPEDVLRACARVRDRQFGQMVALVVGLAAQTHPEDLRAALAQVFDLSAVEDMTRRLTLIATSAQEYAAQAAALCQEVSGQIEGLERRLDAICEAQYRLEEEPPPVIPISKARKA